MIRGIFENWISIEIIDKIYCVSQINHYNHSYHCFIIIISPNRKYCICDWSSLIFCNNNSYLCVLYAWHDSLLCLDLFYQHKSFGMQINCVLRLFLGLTHSGNTVFEKAGSSPKYRLLNNIPTGIQRPDQQKPNLHSK